MKEHPWHTETNTKVSTMSLPISRGFKSLKWIQFGENVSKKIRVCLESKSPGTTPEGKP